MPSIVKWQALISGDLIVAYMGHEVFFRLPRFSWRGVILGYLD